VRKLCNEVEEFQRGIETHVVKNTKMQSAGTREVVDTDILQVTNQRPSLSEKDPEAS